MLSSRRLSCGCELGGVTCPKHTIKLTQVASYWLTKRWAYLVFWLRQWEERRVSSLLCDARLVKSMVASVLSDVSADNDELFVDDCAASMDVTSSSFAISSASAASSAMQVIPDHWQASHLPR